MIRDVRVLIDCTMSGRMDNVRFPCFGANGGAEGAPGRFTLNPDGPEPREIPPASENIAVSVGDLLRVETGGGGGWGDPLDRDADVVLRDVVQGFITAEAARLEYGVVIDPEEPQLDLGATEEIRSRRS